MTLDEHLEAALGEVRLDNAKRINAIRAVATGIFAAGTALLVFGLGVKGWSHMLVPTAVYGLVALVLLIAGRLSATAARLSRFAVSFLDMPLVFAIQILNLAATEDKGRVSEFSLALFVTLIMLSAFTLDLRHIAVALVLAAGFQQVLQDRAGIGIGGRFFSLAVLLVATWICAFAGRNRIELVTRVSAANARRLRLQRYFSPGVGEILEGADEDALTRGKECELSIIFVDIRGFTALSDRLEGREVVALLNAFHARMVEAVFACGGTLDKYLGDGLIAYFNAPVAQPDHAARAVLCALAMEDGLRALNADLKAAGKAPIRIGIGIHTGSAIVGDIGAPHRREFTAIGSAVNVASRLESMTKEAGREIVVSASTRKRIEGMDWEPLGCFPVRGVDHPIELFAPVRAEQEENPETKKTIP